MINPTDLPLRWSRLAKMALSPSHYWHACQDESEDTLSMRVGSVTHALIAGLPVAVFDGPVRRGKEYDAWAAANADATQCNRKEYTEAFGMASALMSHQTAEQLLTLPNREKRIEWSVLGRSCRGTPDAYGDGILVDLKTTRCAQPDRFCRDATFRNYHAQLAWYADGLARIGETIEGAYIVAVENSAPYPVTIIQLSAETLEAGRRLNRAWIERVLACEASGQYPGYTQSVHDWKIEQDIEYVGLEDDE